MRTNIQILLVFFVAGCSNGSNFPALQKIESLEQTNFCYTLDQNIESGKNSIYCPTLLFAWNHLKNETGSVLATESAIVKLINESKDHVGTLEHDEYSNSFSVERGVIKVQSEFVKLLPFKHEMTRNNSIINFNEKNEVESFGCPTCKRKTSRQIDVIHYNNQNDYSVRLKPELAQEQIILYRTGRIRESLAEYYDDFLQKTSLKAKDKQGWRYKFLAEDQFSAPVISFNLEDSIEELIGVKLITKQSDLVIDEAVQRIAFVIDEKGAGIESVAWNLSKDSDAELDKPVPKKLIFDKAFMIILKKSNKENPYFIAWIANDELMKSREHVQK